MACRTEAEKMRQHRESIVLFKPIVFCVKCGSTCIDQNSSTELRCYECGNTVPWDSGSFSIRRWSDEFGEGDAQRAIERAAR